MGIMLGKTVKGNSAFVGTPENGHIALIGKSGVGKSTAMLNLLLDAVDKGDRAIVFNWRNSFSDKVLSDDMSLLYQMQRKQIRAAYDGISIPMFNPFCYGDGAVEPQSLMVSRIASMLSQSAGLSDAQKRKVKEAVNVAVKLNDYAEKGILIIEDLLRSGGSSAEKAIEKMSPFFTTNLLRDGNFLCCEEQIIEIDINDFDLHDQTVIVEFLLNWLFLYGQKGGFKWKSLVIYIDEAQNLSYKPNSPMHLLLNESRKFNIKVFIAAPSLKAGGKQGMNIATMCGTNLFFKQLPSEEEKAAKMIDPCNKAVCVKYLSGLQVGQCLATGSFLINDEVITHPTKLTFFVLVRGRRR